MKKFFGFLMMLLPLTTLAQTTDTENRVWTGFTVEKKLSNHFKVQLNGQVRVEEDVQTLTTYLGELGVAYKLNKHLEVSGFYRFSGRRKWDKETAAYEYRPYHRYYLNASYGTKISLFKFSYRLRYQNQFKDTDTGIEFTKSYLRNKFELAYPNKSKFTPSISADIFYQIGDQFDQIRYKVGVDYDINKRHSIELSGFRDFSLVPSNTDVYTLSISYKLKL